MACGHHTLRELFAFSCCGRTPTKDIYCEVSSCTACIACAAHACTRVRVRLPPSASNDTQCASGLTCGLGTAKVRRIVLPTGQYLTSTPCVVCAVFVCVHVCTVAIGPPSASSGIQCASGLTCGLGTAKVRRIVLPTGQYLTSTPYTRACGMYMHICVYVCVRLPLAHPRLPVIHSTRRAHVWARNSEG